MRSPYFSANSGSSPPAPPLGKRPGPSTICQMPYLCEVLPAEDHKVDSRARNSCVRPRSEQMESRLFLAAERENCSLVMPRLRVRFGGHAAFRFLCHPIQIRGWPQLQARLQQVAVIARGGPKAFTGLG